MKNLFALSLAYIMVSPSFAQAHLAEKQLSASICDCITHLDMDKIKSKSEASASFSDCFVKNTGLMSKVAAERRVDSTDVDVMRQIGVDIGKDLVNENCTAFTRLSLKIADAKEGADQPIGTVTGKLKRMIVSGFNYIIITDPSGAEQSFLWLRQFPGSENFMSGIDKYIGRDVKIDWQEIEAYLPQNKGYYKVKEITGITFL
jgi:hypothetical protein